MAASTSPEALRVATPFGSASQVGSFSAQPSGSVRVFIRASSAAPSGLLCSQAWKPFSHSACRGTLGVALLPVLEALLPLGVRALAALDHRAGVLDDLVGDLEGLLRVEAEE